MDSLVELLKSTSINNFEVGSSHWVDVTHVNNPHSFYVRPTNYRRFMPVLHSYGDRLLPSNLQLGQNVIFKSKLLHCHVRGKVLYIESEDSKITCDLYTPDYGFVEKSINCKRIYKPVHSVNVPPLAIHCQLAYCQPKGGAWTSEVIESMKFFVGKERARIDIWERTGEVFIVDLINSCPDDIATMLALCGYTTIGHGKNTVSVIPSTVPEKQYYTFKELNVGDEMTVRVQTGESLKSFYVALKADYKHYVNEKGNLTHSSKKEKEFKFEDIKVGLPVAVLMDSYGEYERAIIKEITVPDIKVRVQLVDWGKIIEVPYNRLKPISKSFLLYPAVAIYCSADDNQAWDNSLPKLLYPGYEFKIIVIAAGDNFDSPNVVNISRV